LRLRPLLVCRSERSSQAFIPTLLLLLLQEILSSSGPSLGCCNPHKQLSCRLLCCMQLLLLRCQPCRHGSNCLNRQILLLLLLLCGVYLQGCLQSSNCSCQHAGGLHAGWVVSGKAGALLRGLQLLL
jgi:hypothetical protein